MQLRVLPQAFSVCRMPADWAGLPPRGDFVFTGRTDREFSLVCPSAAVPPGAATREDGWRCFGIEGQLDFSLTGILAGIANVLAEHAISIFALSTYDTDYVMVKADRLEDAKTALAVAGYRFV